LKTGFKPYALLFFILLVSYFPIVSFITGVKNDILTGYLPVRFFMSESLSAGYMPWWNPYVNFGIPQYADMSSSFWSPVTWIIAGTSGYNVYTITLELLLYILLGAWGIYKCGEVFGWTKKIKLIAAISYMCCGYMVGHLQHLNWIAGAGFLPWCFWSYHLLLNGYSLKRVFLSVLLFYLLISSSHPGIIIGSIYFFTAYTIYLFFSNRKSVSRQITLWNFSKPILLLIGLLLVVSSALIISYIEILPFITRGEKIIPADTVMNSNSFQSWISFIFPASTAKNDFFFGNDISLRNNYFGLTLFIFLFTFFAGKKNHTYFSLVAGFLFLILSSNNLLHDFCFRFFPLLNYVRLNGEFRIFALFSFILVAANNLQYYQKGEVDSKLFKRLSFALALVILFVSAWAAINIILTKDSILFTSVSFKHLPAVPLFKSIADTLSFFDALVIQSLIQLPILLLIRKYILQKKINRLLLIVVIDLCVATLINLPFTGVGTKSTKQLQTLLNASPVGIPVPAMQPISLNNPGISGITDVLGKWSFYNKQPGTNKQAAYPIHFKNEQYIFQQQVMHFLEQKPFLFFSSNLPDSSILIQHTTDSSTISDTKIELLAFNPNNIRAKFTAHHPGGIVLLYQNYSHWKYTLNGQSVQPENYLNAFSKINIAKPGAYSVSYSFSPDKIKIWMTVSLIAFVLLLISLLLLPATIKDSILQQ